MDGMLKRLGVSGSAATCWGSGGLSDPVALAAPVRARSGHQGKGGTAPIVAEALRRYELRKVYPAAARARAFTPRAGSQRRGNARLASSCVAASCRPPATRAASVLQASGFRGDAAVFRRNASVTGQSGSESAFRRNTAERVYTIEVAHNPEVAGSNPAPATEERRRNGAFRVFEAGMARRRTRLVRSALDVEYAMGQPRAIVTVLWFQ
jgi:hypothetical protein